MEVYKLIQAVEKLIFEVSTWFVFLPITLISTIFRPNCIHTYVLEELKKESQERFQGRINPPLFWVIMGVLPAFATLELWRSPDVMSYVDSIISPDWAIGTKLFTLSVALLTGPTAFSVSVCILQRKRLTRSALEPYFYSQCYIFAPFQLGFAVCALITLALVTNALVYALSRGLGFAVSRHDAWIFNYGDYILIVLVIITIGWFLFSQYLFIVTEVDIIRPRFKRFLHVLWTFFISLVLWVAMISVLNIGSKFINEVLENINISKKKIEKKL